MSAKTRCAYCSQPDVRSCPQPVGQRMQNAKPATVFCAVPICEKHGVAREAKTGKVYFCRQHGALVPKSEPGTSDKAANTHVESDHAEALPPPVVESQT